MFQHSINVIPNQNYHCGNHNFFCSTCKQRFQTEKNFRRHNNSRKHIKQMQGADGILCRDIGWKNSIKNNITKISLLPDKVIEALICDMANEIQNKDDFFNDIQLLNDNEMDLTAESILWQNCDKNVQKQIENISDIFRPKQIDLSRVPATYPCLTCFQLLDSQDDFNAHMLKVHFHNSMSLESRNI